MKWLPVVVIIIVAFVELSTQQGACTQQNPCRNGATCFAGFGDSYYCKCRPGYEGLNCEIANVCAGTELRCLNGGTCRQNFTISQGFSCSCSAQYEGEYCQTLKIDVCTARRPCQNGGTCLLNSDSPLGYRCQCPPSYEGANCETIISNGACSSDPCKNGGTCFRSFSVSSPTSALYICVCRPGYNGKDCEQPPPRAVDACEVLPCLNGGTCFISSENDAKYICLCLEHFSGDHCEAVTIDVPDLCLVHNPCQNSSTCVHLTGAASVTCQCAPGFVGEHCDRVDTGDGPCLPNPCQNGGSCNPDPFADVGYTCSCLPQFSGVNCQREYIGCASDPCQNSGTCVVHTFGAYYCQCQEGFIGRLCEDRGPCADFPCRNGGTCLRQAQVYSQGRQYNCLCPDGYMGTHCEQLASEDPCEPNPCHSGTCYKSDIESLGSLTTPFICLCPAFGTVGDFCDSDPCLSQPCVNGGQCNPIFNPVSRELVAIGCVCPTGFTGPTCAVVGPCQSNPCHNGGICIDSSGSSPDPLMDWEVLPARLAYFCMCPEIWAGTTCSEPSNPCVSSPCFNGGTCNRVEGGFVCQCQGLYDGNRCQTRVDPCSPSPCMNSGRCEVFGETYSCVCVQPFIGTYCERSDPCESSPCFNNGTCFRSREDDQFICQCPEGFTGSYCQIIENHCLSQPCQNGATCFNGGNLGYVCVCANRFRGVHCEAEIPTTTMEPPTTKPPLIPDACRPNPCYNFGSCIAVGSGIFAYTCLCPPDFAGLTCGVHLQPLGACDPNPCLNGGTCVLHNRAGFIPSSDDGYLCICGNAYAGNTCALFVESPDGTLSPGVKTTQRPPITQRVATQVISGLNPTTPRSPDEQICFYDASVYVEGAVRVSDCVRCTCINGEWLCGEKNCDCMIDGTRYRNTDTWIVECNTCICNGGVEICTEMNCGVTCKHNGAYYINGVTRQDACNTCICEEGTWECTDVECGDTCLFGGETYLEGEMRKESCNSCFCLKEAQWLCTVRDCEGSPIIIMVAFKITSEFGLIENNQQKFISVFKDDMRSHYNLAKQNIQNVMVFPGSIEVMFDLVEIKNSNLNVQAVASDFEMKIQSRNYSLNYEGLDLFADPNSFRQERLETGLTKPANSQILGLAQSTFIMIAVVACGAVGLIIVVVSVCYYTRRAPRRAITEYGDTRLPTVSSREKPPEEGFVNSAYENGVMDISNTQQDTQLPRSYRVTSGD